MTFLQQMEDPFNTNNFHNENAFTPVNHTVTQSSIQSFTKYLNSDFTFTYADEISLENAHWLWTDVLWTIDIPLKSWQLGFFLPLWDIANAY